MLPNGVYGPESEHSYIADLLASQAGDGPSKLRRMLHSAGNDPDGVAEAATAVLTEQYVRDEITLEQFEDRLALILYWTGRVEATR